MKRLSVLMITAAMAVIFFSSISIEAGDETSKINDAVEVFEQVMSIPEKGIPPALLNNAHGIAIIPGVIKAGFIIGGRHGTGIVVVRNREGGWSNPSFISLTGGSVGWQIGAQSTDIILVFKSRKGIDNMLKGKFTLGADAAVAAGPVGRQAEAATDIQLKAEIYSYSRSRGLFAGISLEGAALQIDDDANRAFYGEKARAGDILTDKEIKAPSAVVRLKKVLAKYTSNKTKN
ncbi:MAG: YSC84-related protein [Thermodesulfovibrionales bacterium]